MFIRIKRIKYAGLIAVLIILKTFTVFSQPKSLQGLSHRQQSYSFCQQSLLVTKERQINMRYLRISTDSARAKEKKTAGIIFTVLGCGLLTTGIGLVVNANSYSYTYTSGTNGSSSSGDLGGALGVLSIPAGIGLLIPGIIKYNKGSRQIKMYERENNIVKDNSIHTFYKSWSFSYGGAIPLGSQFSSVYGSGISINSVLAVGLFKNKLKLGPTVELDYFNSGNNNKEKFSQIMIGAFVGSLIPLNNRKTTFFYPGIALYQSSFSNGVNTMTDPILTGSGAALEFKTSLVYKSWIFGLSYLNFNPNSAYSDKLINSIQQPNTLYPIEVVTNNNSKLNLSTFRFSIGIIL